MPQRSLFSAALPVAFLATVMAACGGRAPQPAGNGLRPSTGTTVNMDGTSGGAGSSVEELLVGRFPGVVVLRLTNGAISVRIRGASTVMGSGEPLYVLDGVPLDDLPGGALVGVDPNDIARIEVLKDIGSISFYGVRGANGVIVITTKTGRRKR